MPLNISQISVEEPDRSYPRLPPPSEKMLKDPEFKAWFTALEAWWRDAVRALRN